MAVWYVRKTGNDTTGNGTSAATAWATIGKALGAGAGPVDGDTIAIGGGTYRETVTVGLVLSSTGVTVLGDVDGHYTGDAGEVFWTAYDTNDTTLPATTNPPLNVNGKDALSFQKLTLHGGKGTPNVVNLGTGPQNITFTDCKFVQSVDAVNTHTMIQGTGLADTAWNLTFDRCIFLSGKGITMLLTLPSSATANYTASITVKNCIFLEGADGVRFAASGTATGFYAGGFTIQSCTFMGLSGSPVYLASSSLQASAATVTGCVISSIGACLRATTSGQLIEDYNWLYSATTRTLVTAGTHSIDDGSYARLLELGESFWLPDIIRSPFGTPKAGSPFLGFVAPSGMPTVDFSNRPRPAGGKSTNYAVGALERHDDALATSGAAGDGGSGGYIVQTGPSDDRLYIAVDAVSTTISIKFKTASYVGTNYPQIVLLANNAIGVATQTVVAASAATTYTTLTLSAFTPTAKGVVILRLDNRTGDGAGQVFWDTLGIA